MQNSQQPPKYGAEGPPGGVEAWNAQRNAQQAQSQGKRGNLVQRMGGAIAGMNPQMTQQRAAMSQPQPWGNVGRMQWGQPQGGPPQGMPPQAQGMPQGGPPQMPGGAQPSMPTQAAQPPQQAQRQQPDPRMAMLASSPMSGLGMAAARVNALRNRGKVQQ